ncbi:MAG: HIT domain-containing protein [Actinomycetota bacterium]
MSIEDCIFCKIRSGSIPTEFVAETENTLAFRDIAPLAKVHLLVIPKNHYRDVVELNQADPASLAEMLSTATHLAAEHTDGSFQLQFNTGAAAGQTVFHAHLHLLSNNPKAKS